MCEEVSTEEEQKAFNTTLSRLHAMLSEMFSNRLHSMIWIQIFLQEKIVQEKAETTGGCVFSVFWFLFVYFYFLLTITCLVHG